MVYTVVKYSSEINFWGIGELTSSQSDLLFALIAQTQDSESREKIVIGLEELSSMIGSTHGTGKRFKRELKKLNRRLMHIRGKSGSIDGKQYTEFVLLHKFRFFSDDLGKSFLEVSIEEEGIPLLFDLSEKFTSYSFSEYSKLKSKYSKAIFRLLKQYKSTGVANFSKEEFLKAIGAPHSYQESHIKNLLLKPALEELSPFFENLHLERIRSRSRGKEVKRYKFTFKKQHSNYTPRKVEKAEHVHEYQKEHKKEASEKQSASLVSDTKELEKLLNDINE